MTRADPEQPIPAATIVVFRPVEAGPPELLIVERAKTLAFAAGMLVFPGGRVDPGDRTLARDIAGDSADMAARIAAVRECIEEAGLAIGLTPPPDAATLVALRQALAGGQPIGPALDMLHLRFDPAALVPFARWLPRGVAHRVFDTRFYLAEQPAGAPAASVDATEHSRLFWASARDVLAMCDRGEGAVIFPTRRNLERLAQFDSFAAAVADAARWPVRTITPWVEPGPDGDRLHIPGDLGYPVTSESFATVRRA